MGLWDKENKTPQELRKESALNKSKDIVRRIPNVVLTKEQQFIQTYLIKKIGNKFWNYETNKLTIHNKNESYEVSFGYKEIQDAYKSNLKWETITSAMRPIASYGYVEGNSHKGRIVNVFKSLGWDKETGKFNANFNDIFINDLLEVRKEYIKVSLSTINNFTNKYSLPIYEYLKSFTSSQNQINKKMTIEEIREITLTQDSYKRNSEFKRNVLDKVIADLKRSELNITTKIKRGGRGNRIMEIIFTSSSQFSIYNLKDEVKENKSTDFDKIFNEIDL